MRLSKWLSDKCYIFSFLLFCGNIYNVSCEITYVKRIGDGDRFGSVANPTTNCFKKYGANNYPNVNSECQCQPGKATFFYFNNSCLEKTFIENTYGCSKNIITDSIFDLDQQSSGTFSDQIKTISNKSNGKKCSVSGSDYINGANGKLTPQGSYAFTIITNNKGLSWNKRSSQIGSVHGRVIRLQTRNCIFILQSNLRLDSPCIFFKTKGKVNFSSATTTVKTSTAITKTIATSAVYPTSATSIQSVYPTKSPHLPSTHVSTLVKTSVATIPQPSSTPHVLTTTSTYVPVTSSAIPVNPTKPADNKGNKDEQSGAPVGAIVGPVVGILAIAIVIILIFFWRRQKQESTRQNGKVKNGQKHKDNPTYGKNETIDLSNHNKDARITGNELEYDYAAVDGDPRASNGAAPGIYQSLTPDHNRESVYTPLDRQNDPSDIGYNKVERTPFKPARNGPTDPTYNVLERPSDNNDDYLEPGLHIDNNKRPHSQLAPQNDVYQPLDRKSRVFPDDQPVYNVLEGPNPEGEDEPDYNVLEGPYPEGEDEPEYNVLEAPDDQDEPEYNVLEDPDDNYDNAPVEGNKGHPSSHDNVGYASTIDFKKRKGAKNEPVYEAPEGPSSELTYQPLQINGRDDNVYQPLDRTSRLVPDDQPVYHVLESTASEA